MAFTRKFLKALEIDEDKIEQIIDAHTDVTTALKADRDAYKVEAEKLPDVQKELDKLKAEKNEVDPYKEKYEKLTKDFEAYKSEVEQSNLKTRKTEAYKELLKEAGVADKFMDKIIKLTSLDDIELDENGIKGADEIVDSIKKDYDIFIAKEGEDGAGTETPPATNTGSDKLTKDDIYKKDEHGRYVLSTADRQKALTEMMSKK